MNTIPLQPAGNLAEQFNLLKYRLLGMLNGKSSQPTTIAFTSIESGEGVSTVAANFTLALASEDKYKLLLVEANLKRPSLGRLFGRGQIDLRPADRGQGGDADRIKPPENGAWTAPDADPNKQLLVVNGRTMLHAGGNLDLITVDEKSGRQHTPAFNLNGLALFLEKAKEQYDLVIMDCPPLKTGSYASLLASKTDCTVLVVEAHRVRRQALRRAVMQLEMMGANIVGVVLNKQEYPIPSLIYRKL